MELALVRALYTGLTDPTIGINAMIAGLTKDTSTDVLPSSVTVYNYVDHPWVARKKVNHDEVEAGHITFPSVAVFLAQPPTIDPEIATVYRDGKYPVVLGYFTIEPDEVKRMRAALYVNRALLRFLTQFNSNANAAMRFRNNVNVYRALDITQVVPFVKWEAAILAAATQVTFHCREHQP